MNDFILRVLQAVALDNCDDIWWRVDGEYAPITFFVGCNDVFDWGSADCEKITPENIHILEQSYVDVKAAHPHHSTVYGAILFCCRVRGMRPQGCCYPNEKALWKLFDDCGPEREINLSNPYPPGKVK